MARPSKFNDRIRDKVIELAEEGKTEQQIADIIGVHVNTIRNWKIKSGNEEFLWALKEAKLDADSFVEASLFHRACGYSHEEEKVFYDSKSGQVVTHKTVKHYPPDPTSAIFWLKNRKPDEWRDKTEVENTGDAPVKLIIERSKKSDD